MDDLVRLPPHSDEAERAVLGCILLAPADCLIECQERWGNAGVFFDLRWQSIYDTCCRLQSSSRLVDLVTVCDELKSRQELEQVGGLAAVAALLEATPHQSNIAHYVDIVWAHYQRRQAIRVATDICRAAYEDSGNADELLTKFEERVFGLPRALEHGARPISLQCQAVLDRIEHYARGIGTLTGLATGFAYWDKLSAGLQQNELIVIGGRPGTGKTSLAMNVAENVSMGKFPQPVGVVSLEMSAIDLTLRLACARGGVNFHKLRTGHATKKDLERMPQILLEVNKAPIYIDDATGLTVFDVRSRLRAMVQRYGIKLAVVDYLQLISLPMQFAGDPVRGFGDVAKGLMASAKELGIPIIVLSQLSREGEKKGGRPKMSDLRESGDIEACAHFIGILYAEKLSPDEEQQVRAKLNEDPLAEVALPMCMEVCKNRNGPSGTGVQLTFQRWCMRYVDRYKHAKEVERQGPLLNEAEVAEIRAQQAKAAEHRNGNGAGDVLGLEEDEQ